MQFTIREDCWVWTRPLTRSGYARMWVAGRLTLVHRWTYEHFVGPISEGLTIDHLCRNRACVNPEHLEPVTIAVNVQRAAGSRPERQECQRGHALTADNIYVRPGGKVQECRQCRREWKRIDRRRKGMSIRKGAK